MEGSRSGGDGGPARTPPCAAESRPTHQRPGGSFCRRDRRRSRPSPAALRSAGPLGPAREPPRRCPSSDALRAARKDAWSLSGRHGVSVMPIDRHGQVIRRGASARLFCSYPSLFSSSRLFCFSFAFSSPAPVHHLLTRPARRTALPRRRRLDDCCRRYDYRRCHDDERAWAPSRAIQTTEPSRQLLPSRLMPLPVPLPLLVSLPPPVSRAPDTAADMRRGCAAQAAVAPGAAPPSRPPDRRRSPC